MARAVPGELVLITRSEPGATATAAQLRAAGFTPVLTPMLQIAPRPAPRILSGVQAILVTSPNGALRLVEAARPLPSVLTVGSATAAAARAAGATRVISAEGDAAALVDLARRVLDPAAGTLSLWRGREVAADVAGALEDAGFTVEEHVVYAAEARPDLAPEAREALGEGRAAAVLFHSVRGAQAFLAAVLRAGLAPRLVGAIGVALSEKVAGPAREAGFAAVVTAAEPTEPALLDALQCALRRKH